MKKEGMYKAKVALPPAEGAEEYLRKHPFLLGETEDGDDYLSTEDIELIKQLAPMLEEFATLHAQRLAEKMVEERLRATTERCKKLEFMIENGLGWEDMRNDITMPLEI